MKKIVILIILLIWPFTINAAKRNDIIEVEFAKCIDGDTADFTYNGQKIKARFLAIDTPETKHPSIGEEPFGKVASDHTCNAIKNANIIKLEYDSGSDEFDKYNRSLVWVFVDDSLLQKELIEKGYAKVAYLYGNYKYTDELTTSQKIAQNNQLGIWGDHKDYTMYYIAGSIILLIIMFLIISKSKNKETKKIASQAKNKLTKNLNKYLKKL